MEPLTRAEILHTLAAMGVELPSDTRLSDEVLVKRLGAALDAAQEKNRFPGPLDPQHLPQWPLNRADELDSRSRSVLQAVRRGNLQEVRENSRASLMGISTAPELHTNPFMDLRQTIMGLANVLDQGLMWCAIQDTQDDMHAINIGFLHVLELDEKTPAMVVLYRHFTRANATEGVQWMRHQADQNPRNVGGTGIVIKATPLEQKLLLKILGANTRLLPPSFRPERQLYEDRFRASVILPIGPLDFEAIGRLTLRPGCAVCGRVSGSSRCSQCQSVIYCSPACQKADWPSHKTACRSLRGGRWATVSFRPTAPGVEHMHAAVINRYSSLTRSEDIISNVRSPDDGAPTPFPNIHGDKLFLVKLQVGLVGPGRDSIMIYDRQRSFGQVYVARSDDPATFADLVAEMAGPRGGYGGVKMYRWAKRVGDWDFSICVDRKPETDIKW